MGNWIVIHLSGNDLIPYLNRRTSQLISPHTLSKGCITHFLSPEGKILFTAGLFKSSDDLIYAEIHEDCYDLFLQDFETHLFSEDITLHPPISCQWAQTNPDAQSALFKPIGVGFKFNVTGPLALAPIQQDRVLGKIPIFPLDYTKRFSALDSDVIQGISFDKGCYPGQEVVSKTIHIGRAPHQLYWFKGDLKKLYELTETHGGEVTASYVIEEENYGFVKLKRKLDVSKACRHYGITITPHAFSEPLPEKQPTKEIP